MIPTTAWIGLGSNLGDRNRILDDALYALGTLPGSRLVGCSSLVSTAPVGGPPGQGPYLNAAAGLETTLAPHDLLAELQAIEQAAGRRRVVRWGERSLDLDLLLHGSTGLVTPGLTLPHPRLAVRRFVLEPLAQIAPDVIHPTTGQTIGQLLDRLERRPGLLALAGPDHPLKHRLAAHLHAVFSGSLPTSAGTSGLGAFQGRWRLLPDPFELAPMAPANALLTPTLAIVIDPDSQWRPTTQTPTWPLIWPEALDWDPLVAEVVSTLLAAQPD